MPETEQDFSKGGPDAMGKTGNLALNNVICPACHKTRYVQDPSRVNPNTLCRGCAGKKNGADMKLRGFYNNHQKRCHVCGVMFQRPPDMGKEEWRQLSNCPEHRGQKVKSVFGKTVRLPVRTYADPGPKPPLAEGEKAHRWKLRDSGQPQDGYGQCVECGAEWWGFRLEVATIS